jgi:hypothetical protein
MKINYSNDNWFLELPPTKKEWDALLIVCQGLGISFISEEYDEDYRCLVSLKDGRKLARSLNINRKEEEVSFYEMINILLRPEKSAQQRQIEQLENTITKAMAEINFLKTGIKL